MRVVLVALVVLMTGAAEAATAQQTALRIVKIAPLTVRGTGFAAGERIQLVATTGRGSRRVTTRSAATGSFTARFPIFFAVEPCRGTLVVTATRASGERATTKRQCRPGDPQTP